MLISWYLMDRTDNALCSKRRNIKTLEVSSRKEVVLYDVSHKKLSLVSQPNLQKQNSLEVSVKPPPQFIWALKLLIFFLLILAVFKFRSSYKENKCQLEKDFFIEYKNVLTSLESIVGQDNAKKALAKFVFESQKSKKLLSMCVISGPPGVGKTMAVSQIYKLWPSSLRFLVPTNLLPNADGASDMLSDILKHLSCCGNNLIVIENLEYIEDTQIEPLFDFINAASSPNPLCTDRRNLILFTTTDGEDLVEQNQGQISFSEVGEEVEKFLQSDKIYTRILNEESKVVPFYALEKKQVEQCFGLVERDQIRIAKLLKQLKYYKVNEFVFVDGGCRHIKELLNAQ
ncbi:uncharacterized protein LOC136038653 isoform X2 [Artemia franciscana]|uniref:uncharacterized protein LOC136038653 isoform X2 n=1 Tax=Artemia franciscana TaxID=6661 RepID=UPI0032D9F17B